MRHLRLGLCVAAVILATPGAAVAHHGAATFDTGKTLVLDGVVTEWVWANPHCFLKFEVKGRTAPFEPGRPKPAIRPIWSTAAGIVGRSIQEIG